jgi:hypothetical protein
VQVDRNLGVVADFVGDGLDHAPLVVDLRAVEVPGLAVEVAPRRNVEVELHDIEAVVDRHPRRFGVRVGLVDLGVALGLGVAHHRLAGVAVGVHADSVAGLAAEQLPHGLVEEFARGVPQRYLDAADGDGADALL